MNNGEQFIQHRDYVKRSVVQHYLGGRDDPSSGVGLYKKMKGRAYPLYSAGCERVGHTLLASYERPQDSYCASSIPYGPWVEEDDGSVRWLTEAEAGVYMGMSIAEASLLPMEYSTANSTGPNACRVPKRGVYRALGNSIIINMAEKHIKRAVAALGFDTMPRQPHLCNAHASTTRATLNTKWLTTTIMPTGKHHRVLELKWVLD